MHAEAPACGPARRQSNVALLRILEYPDPRLKKVAQPVTRFDERLIVVDVSETKDRLHVLVNPEVVWASEETVVCEEGCLSVPGIYDEVRRPAKVRVRAQDVYGETFELDCEGLLAVCVQHEMDHLLGKIFVEYLSPLKQDRIRTKLRKRKAREAA